MTLRYLACDEYEDVLDALLELKSSRELPSAPIKLCDYFFNTYLSLNCRFTPTIWRPQNNIDFVHHRTNNAIEGWHDVFSNSFGSSKFSFHLLMSVSKVEEVAFKIRALQLNILGFTIERKKKYSVREQSYAAYLRANSHMNSGISFIFEVNSKLNS